MLQSTPALARSQLGFTVLYSKYICLHFAVPFFGVKCTNPSVISISVELQFCLVVLNTEWGLLWAPAPAVSGENNKKIIVSCLCTTAHSAIVWFVKRGHAGFSFCAFVLKLRFVAIM